MFYYAIKNLHITCVVLSAAGFLLRGLWMMTGNPLLQHRLTRILPHLVDTTLLLSAITLTVLIQQYPFVAGWATAKILGLIVYILLGTVALKRGRTQGIRVGAFVAALLVYLWIVSVALTKQAAGYLA
ncbi:SirB2 family protein [Thauera sp. WH-2]|jgi:uncharacterized membrane protein SirB2|uniref:SirB2 family protein n=1 Tax=unclassified Thauera TaxID=2609274 RepID=UPI002A3F3BCF|nr:SirB2 family protein [Thauera sp.]